jgi:hypothetical protein
VNFRRKGEKLLFQQRRIQPGPARLVQQGEIIRHDSSKNMSHSNQAKSSQKIHCNSRAGLVLSARFKQDTSIK